MNRVDEQINELFEEILTEGEFSENRTGIGTISVFDRVVKFDLREGFPLITCRRAPYKHEIIELEGFIKGVCSKGWYESRGCMFWSPFANRELIPYSNDEATKLKMRNEDDLGPLGYSHGWRNFGGDYEKYKKGEKTGVDQLKNVVDKIRKKEDNRRLIVSAWDVTNNKKAALPSCHYSFTIHISPCKNYMDLKWSQRSVDLPLGNAIPKYAALLHLLAYEAGCIPRFLTAHYENVHIYENQIPFVKKQLTRKSHAHLPDFSLKTENFNTIFDWTHEDYELENYSHSGEIKYPYMAV